MFASIFLTSDNPSNTEIIFLLSAVLGTLFFVVKILLAVFAGIGEGLDLLGESGGDLAGGTGADSAHDTEVAFKTLSLTAVCAFFMLFGWAGLSAHVQFQLGTILSVLCATLAGMAAMFATAWILSSLQKLTSAGADFNLQDAVGKQAEVYERIPAHGKGKVQVSIGGMLRELEAISREEKTIDSFTTVEIIGIDGTSGVVVRPVA